MDKERIRSALDTIVRRNARSGRLPSPLRDEHDLQEDFGLNSADVIDVVLDIEEQFLFRITDEEISRFKKFGDLIECTSSHIMK